MDNPALNPREHAAALRSLNRINRRLGIDRRLFAAIGRLTDGTVESLLDVGSGGGGFPSYVAARPEADRPRRLIGLDRSAYALGRARAWIGEHRRPADSSPLNHPQTIWICADARRIPLPDSSVDVVVCSLFLHHFADEDIVLILREFARIARTGVVVADLVRSRMALGLTWLATRLATRSRVVHVDSMRSVRAALRPEELAACAGRAGLQGAIIRPQFPFRMILSWRTHPVTAIEQREPGVPSPFRTA